ncbi:beta-galactosidase [Alicyclobacillus cellulosilyticus]|uniref:Beta-galactosidase n=1 Tax=Alicyclobacillus cellulosilyticus TaxID=1003997 RepID=A0A917K627_9BACL|nr:beta-galactosidase [Alicyclobacillus cellulosilyticus]GGJ02081.1 beta-galactosidase [Alicyclobacillus cellulosilyticus]
MAKRLHVDRFMLGVCYYPEQWPEHLWADDFQRMRELGFSIVRMGEFAWSIFEPEEGRFTFDLFDRAIDLAHQHGLKVILGTPTATPPAWLTHKYPEVLNVSREGVVYQHGQRRHYNYNAPIYRALCARIVEQLASHYKDHPAVVGWQIDNELNCEIDVFYSPADHAAFREWLKRKYGTLAALNEAWGTVFWNQTYSDWDQVHLTRPTVSQSPNPHQALDEKRFFSDSAISFAKLQADIIRRIAPHHWITTNGIFGHLDSHRLTEEALDFISYDSYPNFHTIWPDEGPRPLFDRRWSWHLSVARSISPNFCVMEQQSGPGGWVNRMAAPSPKPGQMRLWTYQSIAHGADMLLYFRWRTAVFGTEIYWHGLNDYHNRPNRRLAEVARIGEELSRIGERIVGSRYVADVGILCDYDNEWDGEFDVWYGPLMRKSVLAWCKALQRNHIPADAVFIRPETTVGDLARYKVLIYPHPAILTERVAQVLSDYVQAGGTLVFGCRTGYKDERGHCRMAPMPGPVAGLCGIEVADFTLIGPQQTPPVIHWMDARLTDVAAEGFNDILRVTAGDAEVVAVYKGDYYDGEPAVVRRRVGQGQVVYYGAAFHEEAARQVCRLLGLQSPMSGVMDLPEDVELAVRAHEPGGARYVFLLNYSHAPQSVRLHQSFADVLTGRSVHGRVEMAPFDVFVLASGEPAARA